MEVDRREALRQRARQILEHNAQAGVPAPPFGADKEWLNVSRALTSTTDLAGKLVLLDFWTACCINCQHVLPELAWLEERYRGEPFVVVGCHSAKFPGETGVEAVRDAVLREGIAHPVVVDREFDIWRRFGVRAWPTLVLIGPDGRILGQVSGEGQGAVLDVLIEQALDLYHGLADAFDDRPLPLRLLRERVLPRELLYPGKLLGDAERGRLWVSDSGHHRVLELDLEGRFLRQFGQGEPGLDDGDAHEARFRGPQGLARIGEQLFVADTLNHALRSIDLRTGAVTTVAGNGRPGHERARTLPAAAAMLNSPWDLREIDGELAIAMAGLHQVWSYDPGTQSLRPLAGDGSEARRDGAFELAALAQPSGLARLGQRLLVADSEASAIRALDLDTRRVSTLAGGAEDARNLFHFGDEEGAGLGRRFQHPLAVECEPDAPLERALAYVADTYNHRIKLLDPDSGTVANYAGAAEPGHADGECDAARFREPAGLSLVGSRLYVADSANHALRVIDLDEHTVRTLALEGVPVPVASRPATLELSELPHLPSTVVHPALRRRLAPGDGTLVLDLALAPGESLAAGAPSQYRVLREGGLVAARQVTGPLLASSTRIELGLAGSGLLRVQLLAYIATAAGPCRLLSHEWRLDIEVEERAGRTLALTLA
ncbi:MAG: thioredoxin-like domain-containing protein [Planctomycetota bacterium]|nr:thioredoxin-like domain-containing protein [Planctomycetota bacterium]